MMNVASMLTLSLLRHAKSSWTDADLDDHDRPLAKRGAKAAPEMAKYMRREELRPDAILCSTAVRTRATAALLIAGLGPPVPAITYDEALYLASPDTILNLLREVPASLRHVLIIGHNPGLHMLALQLVGTGDKKQLASLAQEFPTAALAVFSFTQPSWSELKASTGKLEHFATPKRLQD